MKLSGPSREENLTIIETTVIEKRLLSRPDHSVAGCGQLTSMWFASNGWRKCADGRSLGRSVCAGVSRVMSATPSTDVCVAREIVRRSP